MIRLRATALAVAPILALAAAAAGPADAHDGHDHDAPPPPATVVSAPRGEAASDAPFSAADRKADRSASSRWRASPAAAKAVSSANFSMSRAARRMRTTADRSAN